MSSDLMTNDVDERLVAKAALDAAEEHLRSLCASHASTFVSVERRGTKLEASLRSLQASIANVSEDKVSPAQEALEKDALQQLSENHRLRRRTLLQHSSLLELLELPSLMDACVRSNLYQEALSIASFANALERRQGTNAVVSKVIQQVRTRQLDLHRHLVGRLKHQVNMPECLEIVTSLRRLSSIATESSQEGDAELKLQLDFLEARDAWLDAALRSGDSFFDTIEQYRARYVESVTCILVPAVLMYSFSSSVFEIATQFNAIFRASVSTTPLLSMWTTRRIHSFLALLRNHDFEDSASLRDAWEASIFFATSMGRLGADFSTLLGKLFFTKMESLVTQHWKEGLDTLSETLVICRDAGVASPLFSSTMDGSRDTDTMGQPPRILLTLPPLARLVNAFLVGLNEVRRCLFPELFGVLRNNLNSYLEDLTEILESNERAVRAPGLRGEAAKLREVATQMNLVTRDVVEPYLRGALELALGDMVAAKAFLESTKQEEEIEDEEPDLQEDPQDEEEGEEPDVTEEGLHQSADSASNEEAAAPAVTDTEDVNEQVVEDVPSGDGWDEEDEAVYD